MKKKLNLLFILVMCISALLCFVACGGEENDDKGDPIELTISDTVCSLERFEQKYYSATVVNGEGTVTWTAEDPSVVSLLPNGNTVLVTGIKEGETKLVATLGEVKKDIPVYVDAAEGYPVLTVTDKVSLREGDNYTLTASLTYQGNVLTGANISAVSEDESKVAAQGMVLQGVAPGVTSVTVVADYCNEKIEEKVSVTVVEDISFALDTVEKTLYTSDPLSEGHETSFTLSVVANNKDGELSVNGIRWESEDETVVTVDNGKVSAVGAGETVVNAKWEYEGNEYVASCNVTVIVPRIDSAEKAKDIDLSLNADATVGFDSATFFENAAPTAAYDQNGKPLNGSFDGKAFTFDPTQLALGEQSITFSNGKAEYSVQVIVASMIVSDKSEFEKIKTEYFTGDDDNPPEPAPNRDGYFILDNNIDFEGDPFKMYGLGGDTLGRIDIHGWFGTLDGRGHIVSDIVFGKNGFTDVMGWDAVIKNVGFVDVSFDDTIGNAGIFGEFSYGTIDNCFFHISDMGGASGALGRTMNNVKIQNSVVYVSDCEPTNAKGVIAESIAKESVINNVYAVTSLNLSFAGGVTASVTGNYGKYDTFTKLHENVSSLDTFDGDYWVKENTLIFKSFQQYLQEKFNETANQIADAWVEGAEEYRIGLSDAKFEAKGDGAEYLSGIAEGVIKVEGVGKGQVESANISFVSIIDPSIHAEKEIKLYNTEVITLDSFDIDLSTIKETSYTFKLSQTPNVAIEYVTWNGENVAIQAGSAIDEFTVSKEFLSENLGEGNVIIFAGAQQFEVNVTVATLIVSDWEELKLIQNTYYKGEENGSTYALRDGYFILDADINAQGYWFSMFNITDAPADKKDPDLVQRTMKIGTNKFDDNSTKGIEIYGWSGVLDGRGHTIYNFETGRSGMFGHISKFGLIENVGFICNSLNGNSGGLVANAVGGTVRNVYVELKDATAHANHGVMFRFMNGGTVENVVMKVEEGVADGDLGALFAVEKSAASFTMNNVFIVKGELTTSDLGSKINDASQITGDYGSYTDMTALVTGKKDTLNGFDDTAWTVTDTGIEWITAAGK